MKKFINILTITLAGVFALGTTACNNGGESGGGIQVSPPSLIMNAKGDSQMVTVTGDSWSVSASESWIVVTPAAGTAGQSFTVTVEATDTERDGTITVLGDGGTRKTVNVLQGAPNDLLVDNAAPEFKSFGGRQTVNVTSNLDWTATPNDAWITVVNVTSGSFDIVVESSLAARMGSVTVTNGSGASGTKTVTVTQTEPYGHLLLYGSGGYEPGLSVLYDNNGVFYNVSLSDYQGGSPASGNGYSIVIGKIISELPAEGPKYSIAPGTYTFEDMASLYNAEKMGSFVRTFTGGVYGAKNIISGTFTIVGDYEGYTMTFDLVLDGDEQFKASFAGPIFIDNPNMPDIDGDVDMGTLTENQLSYLQYASFSQTSGSLLNADYELQIGIYAPLGGDRLPADRYKIENRMEAGYAAPGGEFVPGNYSGCWLHLLSGGARMGHAALASGTIEVSNSGSTYTIAVDALDDNGYAITGRFTGELNYTN